MIEKDIKKNVLKDWGIQFPSLTPCLSNSLLKVLSVCIIGIEIMKVPRSNEYRPLFVCYPLWKDDEKTIFSESFILQEIEDRKGLQFDIPYLKHNIFFEEAVICAKKQILIPLEGDVSFTSFINMIDNQLTNDLLTKASPLVQADLYQLKLYTGLYLNNRIVVNQVLSEIKKAMINWKPNLFEWKYGKIEIWYQNLEEAIDNQDLFISKIIQSKRLKNIAKLQHSEIIEL